MSLEKNYSTINFMENNDYVVYADTFMNTIFVEKGIWRKKYGANNK